MTDNEEKKKICGIVMPISLIDGCTEEHWKNVLSILNEAIENAGFVPNIVSNADEIGIIHKRIIQNLYENPIIVCDVSGENPNVMFELGMRLAFDKPVIIVKDDKTDYSFDTGQIEHLEYPRDLMYQGIVKFKKRLGEKIAKTYKVSVENEGYSPFLKNFGEFKVAKLDTKDVSGSEYIIEEIRNLRNAVDKLISKSIQPTYIEREIVLPQKPVYRHIASIAFPDDSPDFQLFIESISEFDGVTISNRQTSGGSIKIDIFGDISCRVSEVRKYIKDYLPTGAMSRSKFSEPAKLST